jgi:5-enolpyruvylshikimate-3-phosphate synthase
MACAVAAIAAEGRSSMDDISCVGKSFPDFFGILEKAGDSD